MRRRRDHLALVVAAALAVLPACTGGSGDLASHTATTTTTTEPAPRPEGVLVPGGSIVLGANDAEVDASFEDHTFTVRTTADEGEVLVVSREGPQIGPTGMPVRCGDVAFEPEGPSIEERTQVAGPSAQVVLAASDELSWSIALLSPATERTHPEGLARLPGAELTSSVLLPPEQAMRLADQPADEPLIVHRWEHTFDDGLVVEAELGGSLARELFYRFAFSGSGRGRVATNLAGISCNGRSTVDSLTDDVTYQLVLLVGGATLQVEGEPVTDTVDDPTLQGSWAVARVTKDARTAKVEVLDAGGRGLDHWTLRYTDPDDL